MWRKRVVAIAAIAVGYAVLTLALAAPASLADLQTTDPLSLPDAWALLAILLVGLPIGAYIVVEVAWWNRRGRQRWLRPHGSTPPPDRALR